MHSNYYVVLLTATIDPGPYAQQVVRNNPQVRQEDYRKSLEFWTEISDDRITGIVFCENSGADLGFLRAASRGSRIPIELISYQGNAAPVGVHYGYSELGIIDYAMKESVLLAHCEYFIKATGRLTFPRISRLLDTTDIRFDAIIDHRRKYRNESGYPLRSRTQLMLFSTDFYRKKMLDVRGEMIGGCSHIEEFIAEKICSLIGEHRISQRFLLECPASGVAGTNQDYHSLVIVSKNMLRAFLRRLLPSLWR
ncbi:hypothetical protein [uncultured Thiodictyon sp.]|uniref:hypothetical protein n=1 Tax=uncultured Thiodictyon sp. TaxID=1846217 RepID=UPI0025DA4F63|nr:hypothetical protein [uncultured Thiodictyon sp.]